MAAVGEAGDKADMNYYKNLLRAKWPEAAIANINYRLASNAGNIHHTEIMGDVSAAVNFLVNNKGNFVVSDSLLMVGPAPGLTWQCCIPCVQYKNKVRAVADFFGPAVLNDWRVVQQLQHLDGKSDQGPADPVQQCALGPGISINPIVRIQKPPEAPAQRSSSMVRST